jgi:hypothetical protein
LNTKYQDLQVALSEEEMRDSFLAFLERAQVSPEEINFDPNFKTHLKVVWGPQGFMYKE